jgi:DinB superfamily
VGIDWNGLLADQLEWHWTYQLRPRLVGLSDQEYLWEPVDGCWNVRPANSSGAAQSWGSGGFRLDRDRPDRDRPDLDPPPVTTIAWRLAHMVVEVLGERVYSHFDGPAVDLRTFRFAGTAGEALEQLDAAYGAWIAGVRSLGADGLARPCGPAEGPFADVPLAGLVLHINREMIHHGAEISTLRDLYRARLSDPTPNV